MSLSAPIPSFYTLLCDAGTGTLHTPFLFGQLALCYALPTVVLQRECKVGGGREDLLLFKGFLSVCGSCEHHPNNISSSQQKQFFPVTAAATSSQFSNTCKPERLPFPDQASPDSLYLLLGDLIFSSIRHF